LFKLILILLFITIITYLIIKNILISNHKIYTDDTKVKYVLHDSDREHINKCSKKADIFDILEVENAIFYTTKKWSTKNNNYIKFKERFYIIEPEYYYFIQKGAELFLNNNCKVNLNLKSI
jgi:hypothetical protein